MSLSYLRDEVPSSVIEGNMPMPEDTLRVGNLVFTCIPAEEHKYTFETSGIKIQLNLGWIKNKAVAYADHCVAYDDRSASVSGHEQNYFCCP